MGSTALDDAVAAFVSAHDDYEVFTAANGTAKVRCMTTGHEMLPQVELCQAHLGSKAYRKAVRRKALAAHNFEQYLPHIVAHKTDPYLLFCECALPHPVACTRSRLKVCYRAAAVVPRHCWRALPAVPLRSRI